MTYDLIDHIEQQMKWSAETFGPSEVRGPLGPLDHIKKEVGEVEADPHDLEEWIDVIILGIDGAWRSGHSPQEIADMLADKFRRNRSRNWPDWRGSDPTVAIEHIREEPS